MDKNHFDSIYKHGAQTEGQCHMVENHEYFFGLGIFDIHGTDDE